jgi:SpoVK/Ycf46/Vps4 family AAA+-type ATPase
MDNSFSTAMWCQGQKDGFLKLRAVAELFFFREWSLYSMSLQPRLIPLISGPSGIGKSHLVRALAADLGLPVLKTSPSSWIPIGVRDSLQTMTRIHEFVGDHDLGIVHLDEADKFFQSASGDYFRSVRNETFDLLDGTITTSSKDAPWNSGTLKKLRSCFMIIGSGTWQTIWSKPHRPSLGFGPQESTSDKAHQIRKDDSIPEELLRRFHHDLILIPPATEEDYRDAAQHFGLTRLAAKLGRQLDFAEAVAFGYGMRWLEGEFTQLLLLAEQQGRSDVLAIRNPYPIQDDRSPFEPDLENLDDPELE